MVQPKIMIFGGYIVQCVRFKMPLKLPQSEVCGKVCGRSIKVVQDGPKTNTLVS